MQVISQDGKPLARSRVRADAADAADGQPYSAEYPAGHRARAHYEYDPGGRTRQLVHWWDDLVNNQYQSTPVLASDYLYDAVLGLRTHANFSQKAPSTNDWVSYAK